MMKAIQALGITAVILLIAWALETLRDSRPRIFKWLCILVGGGILVLVALAAAFFVYVFVYVQMGGI